jgi:acyl carrier protein
VARVDWGVLRPLHEARRSRPFLAHLGAAAAPVAALSAPAARAAPVLAERLARAPASLRGDVLLEYVREEVAKVLGAAEGAKAIPPGAGFFELGMDSLMSVELKKRLERGAGRTLPSTLTFNYPNAAALAAFLGGALAPAAEPAVPAAPAAPASGPIDQLSESELEARLRARLEGSR